MGKERVTAFSDGVLAIIITIMVLELRVPHGETLGALRPLVGVFLSYVLSFIYIGIYWNNHHHLFSVTERVTGGILWANMHLLFWLSLVPFATGWLGESHRAAWPTAVYCAVLLAAAAAYWLLQRTIITTQGRDSVLARAVGRDWKGRLSPACYAAATCFAFVQPWVSDALNVLVALVWLLPDPRIERAFSEPRGDAGDGARPPPAADEG